MTSLAAVVVVASSVLGQAGGGKVQEIKDLGWLVGDWACETTLWDDIQGVGKKGEKIEITSTWRWTLNGTMLQENLATKKDGKVIARAKSLVAWHPAKKQIVHWWFSNVGTVYGQGDWSRDGNVWIVKGPIVRSDGKEETGVWIMKKVDNDEYVVGRTHLNGKPEPTPLMDGYKRVEK